MGRQKLDLRADADKWRPLAGYESYRVNGAGEIIRIERGRYMKIKPIIDSGGNCSFRTKSGDKIKYTSWGRIVYQSFCGPLPAGAVVIHKNRDKRDNSIRNLQAVPKSQNGAQNGKKARRRAVMVRDNTTGEILDIYQSAADVAESYGLTQSAVTKRCNGIRGNTGRYSFEWEIGNAEWNVEKRRRKVTRRAKKRNKC